MKTEEDFLIVYKGKEVKVTSVLDEANIHFIVHFAKDIIIAEEMVNGEWQWNEKDRGETDLSIELGEIIDQMEI